MAIAFDAASASGGKNVTTHPTISHTIGSGSDRMLAAWALQEDPVTQAIPSTYTYNGTALILSNSRVGDSKSGAYAYYIGEGSLPTGGAYNLILTWDGNCQDSMAGCISLTGVKDQAPEATGANGSGSDQSSGSASITTVTANAWVLIGNTIGGNYTLSYDTSNQRATGNTTGANASIGDEAVATAGAKSIGWTATSARYWTMVLMAFEPAGVASGTIFTRAIDEDISIADIIGRGVQARRQVQDDANLTDDLAIVLAQIATTPIYTAGSFVKSVADTNAVHTLSLPVSVLSDRRWIIANLAKDNQATPTTVTAITFNSLSIGSGIVEIGSRQVAQEGNFSSQAQLWMVKDADGPTVAGNYDVVLTSPQAAQGTHYCAFEISNANQSDTMDAIALFLSTVDISANNSYSHSITTVAANCLIIDLWSQSNSTTPTITPLSGQTQIGVNMTNSSGGANVSYLEKAATGAQTMGQTTDALSQRQAGITISITVPAAASGTIFTRAISENINVEDVTGRDMQAERQIQDAVSLADTINKAVLANRATVDRLNINDAIDTALIRNRAMWDSLGMSDELQEFFIRNRMTADSVDVTDLVERFAFVFRGLQDNIDLSDVVERTIVLPGGVILSRVLQDNINLLDVTQRTVWANRQLQDDANVTEGLAVSRAVFKMVQDNLLLTDVMVKAVVRNRGTVDVMDVTDELIRNTFLYRTIADALTVTDDLTVAITYAANAIALILTGIEAETIKTAIEADKIITGTEDTGADTDVT